MSAIADLLALGVIAAIGLLILSENRERPVPVVDRVPVVDVGFLTADQLPHVTPCITPPPGPRHIPERNASWHKLAIE